VVVIIKHILCTYGMPYFVYSDSSWLSITEYITVGRVSNNVIVFKQICIKHLPTLCQRLLIPKGPYDLVAALQGSPFREREAHGDREGNWDILGADMMCAQGSAGANEDSCQYSLEGRTGGI